MKVESYPLQKISDFVQYLNGTTRDENGLPYVFMYPYGLPDGTDTAKFVKWHKDNILPRPPFANEFAYVDIADHSEFNVTYKPDGKIVPYNPICGFALNGTFKGTLNITVKDFRITSLNSFAVVKGTAPYNVRKVGNYEYVNLIGDDVFNESIEGSGDFTTTNFQPHDCSGAFENCSRLKRTPDNLNWDVASLHHHYSVPPYNPISGHYMAWFVNGCGALEEVPSYKNAPNRYDVTNTLVFDTTYDHASMQQMCANCKSLRSFGPVLDFTMTDMTLTTDYLGDKTAPIFAGIFANCSSLTDVRIKGLHGKDFDFTQGHFGIPNIDKDSIEYILNNVIGDGNTYTLTFSNIHQSEVNAAAIANAQAKGFNIEWVEYFDRFNAFNTSDWVFNTAQQPDMQYTLEDNGNTLSITKFKPNIWMLRSQLAGSSTGGNMTSNEVCVKTCGWKMRLSGLVENADIFEYVNTSDGVTTDAAGETGANALGDVWCKHSEVGGSGSEHGRVMGFGVWPICMQRINTVPGQSTGLIAGQLSEMPWTGFAWESITREDGTAGPTMANWTDGLRCDWGGGRACYGYSTADGMKQVLPRWSNFNSPYSGRGWQISMGIYTDNIQHPKTDADGYITLETPIKISLVKERKVS